jgi:hypothetical protein
MNSQTNATEAAQAAQHERKLTIAITEHLRFNHVPAVHSDFAGSAKAAISEIDAYRPHTQITMPNGTTMTASEIASGLHLDGFCQTDGDEFYGERIEGDGAGEPIDLSLGDPTGVLLGR